MTLAIAVDIALAIVYRTGRVVDIRSDSQWISCRTRYRVALAVDIVLAVGYRTGCAMDIGSDSQ
jgi:hypothetical protein